LTEKSKLDKAEFRPGRFDWTCSAKILSDKLGPTNLADKLSLTKSARLCGLTAFLDSFDTLEKTSWKVFQ
jgi:hypothetical protein